MTRAEGRGVQLMLGLLDSMARHLGEDSARSFIDGLEDDELCDVAAAASGASRATIGEPQLLIESLAARVRGVDVATQGSGPLKCGVPVNGQGPCVRPLDHEDEHALFCFESDTATTEN